MAERVDDLGRRLVRRVEDIADDVSVLRRHLGDLRDEVTTLRYDIVGRRWVDRGDDWGMIERIEMGVTHSRSQRMHETHFFSPWRIGWTRGLR